MNLYRMTDRNTITGEEVVIYGHVTINVILKYIEAYVDKDHEIIVSLVDSAQFGYRSWSPTERSEYDNMYV